MSEGTKFLAALETSARRFAPAARATYEANQFLCAWMLDPLARWAEAAYGARAFEDAAKGYAKYCFGVWKSQQLYEKNGRYTPEKMPDLIAEVYEDEGYMVPYMWAAILIYPLWPSMISHIALYRNEFLKRCRPRLKSWSWPAVMECSASWRPRHGRTSNWKVLTSVRPRWRWPIDCSESPGMVSG